ncbi:histidine N-acetyltransferase-like [Dendronephthya gigantea]|uniref:histidine N-acetyltransferase-like n=1 Tax=Dendronephthya gigantea TaxID=151771 RepID=UPI00106ABD7D|nr:histidine N-acetyltransferase-like [Dendronephthya gigantea]
MANVVIRLADEADLPAVIRISESVYGGNDYFLGEFLNFVKDPNRLILIAEKDGKAVGLQVIHIIDDGETAIAQSLRVHLEYRRQGIGKRLIQECRNFVRKNFPKVKFERYSVTSQGVERLGIQKKSADVLFHEVIFFACLVNGAESELSSRVSKLSTDQCSKLKQLNRTEFECLLNQEELGDILFQDTYIVHWQPFKALASNIPKGLLKDGDTIFTSYSGESVQALSHSRWCPIDKCPQLITVCYTLDEEFLKMHLIGQLENGILQHPGETFLFVPLVNTSLVDCTSQILLRDLSLAILQDEFGEKEQYNLYLFEKSLV